MDKPAINKSEDHKWEDLIEAHKHSGQTIKAFCEAQQIKQHVFYYWRKKLGSLARQNLKRGNSSRRFIAIAKRVNLVSKAPRIHLPNGVQIDLGLGLDSGLVNQFLKSLCGVAHPLKEGHNAKS